MNDSTRPRLVLLIVTLISLALCATAHPAQAVGPVPRLPVNPSAPHPARRNNAIKNNSHAAWQAILAMGGQDLKTLCQSIEPKTTQSATSLTTTTTTTTTQTSTTTTDATTTFTTTDATTTIDPSATGKNQRKRGSGWPYGNGGLNNVVNSILTKAFQNLYAADPSFVLQQCQAFVPPATTTSTTQITQTATATQTNIIVSHATATATAHATQYVKVCFACPAQDASPYNTYNLDPTTAFPYCGYESPVQAGHKGYAADITGICVSSLGTGGCQYDPITGALVTDHDCGQCPQQAVSVTCS